MNPTDADPDYFAGSHDLPLVIEDLLVELDDLVESGDDPVLVGELWALALELLRR